jgi:hypothetical protein
MAQFSQATLAGPSLKKVEGVRLGNVGKHPFAENADRWASGQNLNSSQAPRGIAVATGGLF